MKQMNDTKKILDYETALNMLYSFNLKEGDDWDKHCINVGNISYIIANELSHYIDIDADKAKIFGLIHDFGRSVTHDPYRHGYEGYRLMKKLGYDDYARICTCHSNGTYKIQDLAEYGLSPEDFFVETWEEKAVFIADSIECKGEVIRHDDRIRNTIERYKFKNPEFIPVLESKLEEFKQFDHDFYIITGKTVYQLFGI